MKMFIAAAKQKLRFATNSGMILVEDLWDLSLRSLNTMAVGIHTALEGSAVSFIEDSGAPESVETRDNKLRLEIIKAVIADKQAENKARKDRADLKAREEFLKGLLEKKKLDELEGLSLEDIEAQLAALRGEEPAAAAEGDGK